jgi:hypothetical protein
MERLSSMTDKFHRERDMTYRDQLQKIQFDINLVQRFDPYDPKVLEVISGLQKEHTNTQGPPVNAEDARSLLDMAGIRFSDFVDEVEDLVEIRDFQLAQSKVRNPHATRSSVLLTMYPNRMNTTDDEKNTETLMITRLRLPSASIEPLPAPFETDWSIPSPTRRTG